jgi:ADP-heptose:LPS heptosyltransferase
MVLILSVYFVPDREQLSSLRMDASTPLRGKYLVRNRIANRLLAAVDGCLRCVAARPSHRPIATPRRILLANGAHLGDVLLATAVLPVLKQAFREASLGFLIGSWARPVLDGHPLVDAIHCVDHWKLNRAPISMGCKLRHYRATRAAALQDIRSRRYDIAFDLYFFFPNYIPLLWQAGIPARIGYTSGGFGPLLTHALDWTLRDCHVIDYHRALLDFLPLGAAGAEPASPQLAPTFAQPGAAGDYVILHPGAGSALKEWPRKCWMELIQLLRADGHTLVFTGTAAEKPCVDEMAPTECVNLCGRLSWPEFVATVRGARALVGVDSVAGHVAAAVGTPWVVIASGIPHPAHWRPRGAPGQVVTHPVACSPCYRRRGCATMDCVRQVAVEQVHAAVREVLQEPVALCSTSSSVR